MAHPIPLLAAWHIGPLILDLPWWILAALLAYWAVVVVLLISDNRKPASTLLWLFTLVVLPGLGLVLFLFFGRDWKVITARRHWAEGYMAAVRAKMQPIYDRNAAAEATFEERYDGTFATDISAAIRRENGSYPLPADSVEIFTEGAQKFARLEQDLAAATSFINMEYFIWEQDELTAKISEILLERMAAGVEVRILYDYIGSISFKKAELKRLEAAGAKVSADVKDIFKLNYRNHRKIAVIDGAIGYTGGMNMGQEYIDGGVRFPTWRDTHLRVTGQAVAELQKLFSLRWFEVAHEDLLLDRFLPAAANGSGAGGVLTQLVAHTIEDPWEAGRRAHMIAISQAEKTLRIQSPYFVPDQGTYDALINASLSGVDLKFMMTGWVDKKLPFWAAQTYYEPLLRAGGRIFQYTGGFFHAKTIAVDSAVSAVGTMNMDIRSLQLHKEVMEWIYDAGITAQLEEIFDHDLEQCREITLADIRAVGRVTGFRNSVARLFSAQI
jgi:Phosphatidylserine/phosphatidylglycerophosphate/cardiolipin synthases and related enzymes